jgi:energy-coupling factor transporter ATP-binding protein EcfA2
VKLRAVAIQNMRGLREFALKTEDRSVVLVGPNGSGKSSVVDGLDFLLTGQVHRLQGEGARGLSLAQHGKHIDAEVGDAWVEATFVVESAERSQKVPAKVRRSLKPPALDPAVPPPPVTALFSQAERLRHHLLSRRDILRLVLAPPADRREQVAALLDLEEIEDQRKELTGAAKDATTATREARGLVQSLSRDLLASVGPPARDPGDFLGRINAHRATLDAPPIPTLKSSPTVSVTPPDDSGEQHPLHAVEGAIRRLLADDATRSITTDLDTYEARLRAVSGSHANRAHIECSLIDAGLDLLDGHLCPLCESAISADELRGRLTARRAQIESAAAEVEDLRTERRRLTACHSDISRDVRHVAALVPNVAEARGFVDFAASFAIPPLPEPGSDPAQVDVHRVGALSDALRAALEPVRLAASATPKPSGRAKAWLELEAAGRKLQELAEAERALTQAQALESFISAAEKAFVLARGDVVDDIHAKIAARAEKLYGDVHGTDAGKTALISTKTGLELVVGFHGRGEFPPSALHSEGQQDTLGICLFLALAEHASGGAPPLLILDDVLMSVDADHRRAVAELLKTEFASTQFIITTHDEVWARQLRSLGVVAKAVHFGAWAIDGIHSSLEPHDAFVQMRADLEAGRVPTAAHLLRRTVETVLPDICEALGARVTYRKDQKPDLGDFFGAAKKQLAKLLRDGVAAAKSWKRDTSELDRRLVDYVAARDALGSEEWSVNPTVHYNEWAQMTRHDFEPVVAAYEKFLTFFACPDCHGLLYVEGNGDGTAVRCPCGTKSWNLTKAG